MWENIWAHIVEAMAIEPTRIPAVVLAAVVVYLSFLFYVRVFGARILARFTAFDAVVVIMFGSVAGRVIIGHPPTVMAGLIGLGTLMVMEIAFGTVRRVGQFGAMLDGKPQVIIKDGQVLEGQLRKTHMSRWDIKQALRRAGVSGVDQVQLLILETTGDLSIYRVGQHVSPSVLRGVVGADNNLSVGP